MVTSFSYDNNGNLLTRKVGEVEKSFEYDSMNRITKEFTAGALTASYTYDAANNISAVTDGLGNHTRVKAVLIKACLNMLHYQSYYQKKPCKRGNYGKEDISDHKI